MKKHLLLLGSICLLLLPGIASAQVELSAKDNLTYLLGSWATEYEFPGMGAMREEATYTKGDDANTVIVEFKVFNNGNEIDNGVGKIVYDPATNTVSSWTSSKMTGAEYTSKEVKREGAVIWMEGTSNDPMMAKYRIKIVVDSKDAHTWTMYMPDGDGWKELLTTTYKRTE